MQKKIHVIMTGGVGSRLWPLSRKSRPKQYLNIFGEKNLFQLTAERNAELTEKLIVVGNKDNYKLSEESLKKSEIDQYDQIIEAAPRNTAAAVAFAAFAADKDDLLLITPADHIIENQSEYQKSVKRAFELAEDGKLVTFGINPSRPETGYGYIEAEDERVLSFREKPDKKTAEEFLEKGNFFWNSGIFSFKAGVFLDELKKYRPQIFEKSRNAYLAKDEAFMPETETMEIPSESIDYAVMENSDNIAVVQSSFEWSDLGSFEALYDYFRDNNAESMFIGSNLVLGNGRHIELLGIENSIVVDTDDALLIINKSQSQEVKKVFERLEQSNSELVD